MPIDVATPPIDRDARFEDAPPEPAWVADAHRESVWAALAAAVTGPVGRDALTLLAELDPEQLASQAQAADRAELRRADVGRDARGSQRSGMRDRGQAGGGHGDDVVGGDTAEAAFPTASRTETACALLDGITMAQRVVNHVQAVQQRLIAALSRPGVAVPLAELIDLAGTDLTDALASAVDAAGDAAPPAAAAGMVTPVRPDRDPQSMLTHPVHGAAIREAAVRAAAAEIGCALNWAPVTARMRCEAAIDMVDTLPATLGAQQRGDVDSYRARLIADRTAVLSARLRRRIEQRILPIAGVRAAAGLRRILDREVIAADPAAAQRRVEAARQDRTVIARRGEDDMGVFTAIIPAADSDTAYGVMDSIAAQLSGAGCAEGRSRSQLRADAFTDLFRSLAATGCVHLTDTCSGSATTGAGTGFAACGAPGSAESRPGAVGAAESRGWPAGHGPAAGHLGAVVSVRRPVALNVYLDVATLARLDDQPGELAGYGAITAETARAIAASADTIRAILRRPVGGGAGTADAGRRTCDTVLDAGRAVYRPPDATADYVTARDRTCRFPGCRAPAARCDLDHRQPFDAGGDTCPHNIDALCRGHHRMKTFTAWRATRDPDTDRLSWTSPLGYRTTAEHAHILTDDLPPF